MIKGKQKNFMELKDLLRPHARILIVGCGGCVSVCLAGGQREVELLISDARKAFKAEALAKTIDGYTVERQCNEKFLAELDIVAESYDCIMSMACGAGVQYVAERFPDIPVYPALNTVAIGIDRNVGIYEERCRACGECVLAYTGGVCPVTRCSKGLFNGPCGGTNKGKCEISNQVPCAWQEIYERLKRQNRLDDILKLQEPMEWQNQAPRTVIQRGYE